MKHLSVNRVRTSAEQACTESHEQQKELDVSPCENKGKRESAAVGESVQNGQNWAVQDLNLWLPACKAGALAN